MHEFGLCDAIVEAVQRRAQGRPVAHVRVRAGALLRIADGAFAQAFAHAATGTEAEHSTVDLVVLPARARCRDCNQETESTTLIAVCQHCGGVDLALTGGEELILESIEYAAPDNAPVAG